jgi:AcrR family transcriptional regulator
MSTEQVLDAAALPPSSPRVRRSQAERTAESDRRMLDAATRLIASQGYMATTLEAIGNEAGYSRQLVAQRFGSKDKLLETVIARHADALRERLRSRRSRLAGLAGLYSEIDSYLQALDEPSLESRAFFVLMLESAGPAPQFRPAFAAITARWEERLAQQIRESQAQGSLRADVDARIESKLLIATLRGIRIQSMMDPGTSDVPAAANSLKAAIAERLTVPRASR